MKFIKSNFLPNLNKFLMVINTTKVAEIQILTLLLSYYQSINVQNASQWTHLELGMTYTSVYHGRTMTSHGVNKTIGAGRCKSVL